MLQPQIIFNLKTDITSRKMPETIVYYDEDFPSSWIWKKSAKILSDRFLERGINRKDANQLRAWIGNKIEEGAPKSTVIFAQDIVPATVLRENSPNDLIRRYLDEGGRIIWIGDVPFWTKGHSNGEREDIWQHGAPQAVLGIQPLIGEAATTCRWRDEVRERMESEWYCRRPVVADISKNMEITFNELAVADVTLLPCSYNVQAITRWKKAGKKVGAFEFSAMGLGGGVTLTEEYPEELSLTPREYPTAWHLSFNDAYPAQGFYRLWDCMITRKPPQTLLNDIDKIAGLNR